MAWHGMASLNLDDAVQVTATLQLAVCRVRCSTAGTAQY